MQVGYAENINNNYNNIIQQLLRVQQHIARSKEKKIEHNPMPLGCVVFLAEELLRLFFKNKKNEEIVF